MAMPYTYTPLKPRNIRVFQVCFTRDGDKSLFKATNTQDEASVPLGKQVGRSIPSELPSTELLAQASKLQIKVRFKEVCLDLSANTYRAISYVWGSSTTPNTVRVDDDSYVKITDSVAEILHWVAAESTEDYYWLDAMCINQCDNEEKSDQVRMMYQIYSQAEEVIAWVGRPTDENRLALEFVQELQGVFETLRKANIPVARASVSNIEACAWPSAKWTALTRFLEHDYFRRLWIVQEMVAATIATLRSGPYCISWTIFSRVMIKINATGLTVFVEAFRGHGNEYVPGLRSLNITSTLRANVRSPENYPTLPYFLTMCQSYDCTDPRDRLYALLDMAGLSEDSALAPRYDQSVEEAFTQNASVLLTRESPMLSLLYSSGTGYDRKTCGIPSWVPDCTTDPGCLSFGTTAEVLTLTGQKLYYACGQSYQLHVRPVRVDRTSIILKGRVIDTIRSYSPEKPTMENNDGQGARRNSLRYSLWLLQLYQSFPPDTIYPTGTPFFPHVLSQTLVAGMNEKVARATSDINPHFVDFFAMHLLSCGKDVLGILENRIPKLVMDRCKVIQPVVSSHPTETWSNVTNDLLKSAYHSTETYDLRVVKRRKFFITTIGYVGLGPLLLKEGDLICLIYGTEVPFIIRKLVDTEKFELVGECYVHGLMYGEGMSMGTEQDIHLC